MGKRLTWWQIALIVLVVIALLVLLFFVGRFLFDRPAFTATLRDLFIILLALESLVIGVLLIVLVIQIANLTLMLQREIKPILDSTSETVSTVRGTTVFVSDHFVKPMVQIASYVSAVRGAMKAIFRPRPRHRAEAHEATVSTKTDDVAQQKGE